MRDRGVSTVVSYVLALGIVAILSSALIVSFAPFVTNQQQRAAQSTLAVYGNDLAGDIDSADRLAMEAGTNGTVELRTQFPDRVSGSRYEIEIAGAGENTSEITLQTVDFEASAIVTVRTTKAVAERTGPDALEGGSLVIEYEPANDQLVVRNA